MTPPAAYPPGTPERDVYVSWRDAVAQGMWSSSWALLSRLAEPDVQVQPEANRMAMLNGILEGVRMLGPGESDGVDAAWEQTRPAPAKAAS